MIFAFSRFTSIVAAAVMSYSRSLQDSSESRKIHGATTQAFLKENVGRRSFFSFNCVKMSLI